MMLTKFTRYPKIKEYINLKELDKDPVNVSKKLDNLHHRGPFVFFMLILIIGIHLIQLHEFNVEDINDLRQSLRTLFYISPENTRLNNIYYFSETTSRTDFSYWLYNMTRNIYVSNDPMKTPNNFFSKKCICSTFFYQVELLEVKAESV